MNASPVRVLFTNWIDRTNYNAQSLNVREIALRLDPARFASTLFYERDPDGRLWHHPGIRLVKIPPRLGTATMLGEALRGHDLFFRVNLIRFTDLWLTLPRSVRHKTLLVDWLEAPAKQYAMFASNAQREQFLRVQAQVDHRVAMTEFVARTHRENFGFESEAIIPAGVDTGFFVPPPARDHVRPVILFVGHLIERKNPHAVLLAARRFPGVQFVIVGAARDAFGARLVRLKDKWGLSNVTIRQPMGRDDLRALMWECDILFHPSKIESIAKVVLEGGAAGMPGILFDHFDSPAVLDGATGYQVKTFEEMMEKLGMLIENSTLRRQMGMAAVEHARRFDWDEITAQWARLLSRVTGRV